MMCGGSDFEAGNTFLGPCFSSSPIKTSHENLLLDPYGYRGTHRVTFSAPRKVDLEKHVFGASFVP